MTDWYVGQRVVCLNGRWDSGWWKVWGRFCLGITLPKKSAVYTIAEIHRAEDFMCGLGFELDECGKGWLFNSRAFRPLVSQDADISVFTKLLEPLNKHKTEDA